MRNEHAIHAYELILIVFLTIIYYQKIRYGRVVLFKETLLSQAKASEV